MFDLQHILGTSLNVLRDVVAMGGPPLDVRRINMSSVPRRSASGLADFDSMVESLPSRG